MKTIECKRLPRDVQDIAEVIGVERALFLVGQLPRCYVKDKRKADVPKGGQSERVIMYVPRNMKPDHQLVRILGWKDAAALQAAFPGEIMQPGTCQVVYRDFRNQGIARMSRDGVPNTLVAEWFGVSDRFVRKILQEIPQVETRTPANDNAA